MASWVRAPATERLPPTQSPKGVPRPSPKALRRGVRRFPEAKAFFERAGGGESGGAGGRAGRSGRLH